MPKRRNQENKDDEECREGAKASRAGGNSIGRPLLNVQLPGSQVVQAAAGHGRSSNSGNSGSSGSGGSGGGGGSGGSSSSNSGGGSGSYCGGGGGGGGGGGAMAGGCGGGGGSGGGGSGGGAGGGGMNPGGNGGRGNYGPSSPPTASLPPFYESLKGGNNLANFANQYNSAQGECASFLINVFINAR